MERKPGQHNQEYSRTMSLKHDVKCQAKIPLRKTKKMTPGNMHKK